MIRKTFLLELLIVVSLLFSCGSHDKPTSDTMTKIIEINVKMWEDLNAAKKDVKTRIANISDFSSETKTAEEELAMLNEQSEKLKELDALIPELEGYEPKCTHEPGEPHTHNSVKIDGVPENDLFEIHRALRSKLDLVQAALR